MKNVRLIDFTSLYDFSFTDYFLKNPTETYKDIKHYLERLKFSNDFEHWFSINLEINHRLLNGDLTIDECLSLSYYLKKVEESNIKLEETIRIWREDESQLPSDVRLFINNTLFVYYTTLLDESSQVISDGICYREYERICQYPVEFIKKCYFPINRNKNLLKDRRFMAAVNLINKHTKEKGFGLSIWIIGEKMFPSVQNWFADEYR